MRRVLAFVLLSLFVLQSTASAAVPSAQVRSVPSVHEELALALQPAMTAFKGTQLFALLTGQENRYSAMHRPKPQFDRNAIPQPSTRQRAFTHTRQGTVIVHQGERRELNLKLSANKQRALHDPLAETRRNPVPVRLPVTRMVAQNVAHSRNHAAAVGVPTLGPIKPTAAPSTISMTVANGASTSAVLASAEDNGLAGNGVPTVTLSDGNCSGIVSLTSKTLTQSEEALLEVVAQGLSVGSCTATATLSNGGIDTLNISVTASPTPLPTATPTATPVPTPTPIPVTPAPAPTTTPVVALVPETMGLQPWWSYFGRPIPGGGSWEVNVANGNYLVQTTDVDVPERGVDLSFTRVYNSQSAHDQLGSDGSVPSAYGNGWTNTFDAHLSYNAVANVMSVYDSNGTRLDYASNGNGGWTPPTGVYATLTYDGGCGYEWTQNNGLTEYFYSPSATSCTGLSTGWQAGYAGRLIEMLGRNSNNAVTLTYSWRDNNADNPVNLTGITATHSDGQSLILTFATINGVPELSSITRPDGQVINYVINNNTLAAVELPGNATATTRIESYTYNGNLLIGAQSPLAAYNEQTTGSETDGDEVLFNANGSQQLTSVVDDGIVNLTFPDGTNTQLQPGQASGVQQWRTVSFIGYASGAVGTTSMTDHDGHATTWSYDQVGRATTIETWPSDSLGLVTDLSWDNNNNITSSRDTSNNLTVYSYDANGNLLSVQLPQSGSVTPTALYAYDQFNNLTAYCDPAYVARTKISTCTPASGVSYVVFNYSDTSEPFGFPTDTYSPLGYHTAVTYNQSTEGGDFGLQTDIVGDAITQADGSIAQPQEHLSYDEAGDVTSASNGIGSTSTVYDSSSSLASMHWPIAVTDADGIETRYCYNADGSLAAQQSAKEFALDGSVCGSNSEAFSYDADGNRISDTHHYGGVAGKTQYYYDGDDRLAEVVQPADSDIDFGNAGMTRYLYDLSQGGSTLQVGGGAMFAAHGNLYKTQRCNWPTPGPGEPCTWTDIQGDAYDALDRTVSHFAYQPFGALQKWMTTYDQNGFYGFATSHVDPQGLTTTLTYTPGESVQEVSFSDGTPSRTYAYDADGRVTGVASSANGTDLWAYDAQGDVSAYQEGSVPGATSRESLAYTYYPNGWRKSLNIGSSAFPAEGTTASSSYSYRSDGLRQTLGLGAAFVSTGSGSTFGWKYTPAGRETAQTDPYTGTALAANTGSVSALTLQATMYAYDSYGELSSETLPSGSFYSNLTYDPEGEVTGLSVGMPSAVSNSKYVTSVSLAYNIRGELRSEIASSASAQETVIGQNYQYDTVSGNGQVDPVTGALDPPNGTDQATGIMANCGYDSDGRFSFCIPGFGTSGNVPGSETYDAEGHLVQAATTCGPSDGFCAAYGYTYGPTGQVRLYSAAQTTGSGCSGQFAIDCSSGTDSLHWDGNQLLYITDANGNLVQANVEGLAVSVPAGLHVLDRDFAGFQADMHDASATSGTSFGPNYTRPATASNPSTGQAVGMYPGAGAANLVVGYALSAAGALGTQFSITRPDGYQIGSYTFQGVRAVNPATGQWMTPDTYGGTLDDPISQRAYTWVGNNPVTNSDPSGYATAALPFCDDPYNPDCLETIGEVHSNNNCVSCGLPMPGSGGGGNPSTPDPCFNATLKAAGVNPRQQIATAQAFIAAGKLAAGGYIPSELDAFAPAFGYLGSLLGYAAAVNTGGPNDIKDLPGHSRANKIDVDAGNISYGITCPFGSGFCQFSAGLAQTVSGDPDLKKGSPLTGFDSPGDNAAIRVGQALRAAGCHE